MPSPTSSRGSGKTSSTACSARIGPPAAIRPTQRHVGRGGRGRSRGARRAPLGAGGERRRVAGQPHVERARPVRVAPQPALLLQHRQLVGDRRRRGQPDRLADLADRGRVAAALDRVADDLEHPALALGQPVAVGTPVGEGAHRGRPACPPPRPRTPCGPSGVPLFSATSPPRPPLARRPVFVARTVARRRPQIKHMFEVRTCPVAFVGPAAVDIAQPFDSNDTFDEKRSAGAREERVMGCVQQAVLEFDEEVRAPWRPRLVAEGDVALASVRPASRRPRPAWACASRSRAVACPCDGGAPVESGARSGPLLGARRFPRAWSPRAPDRAPRGPRARHRRAARR